MKIVTFCLIYLVSIALPKELNLAILPYSNTDDFTMTISGTSNIHDWVSDVTVVNCNADLVFSDIGISDITGVSVSIPSKSILSSKGSIMNKKTWKALKTDQHEFIKYTITECQILSETSSNFTANVTGDLNIAGTKKSIQMKLTGITQANGDIQIKGSKEINMEDFNVDPPKALMGALTTGKMVTIDYALNLRKD